MLCAICVIVILLGSCADAREPTNQQPKVTLGAATSPLTVSVEVMSTSAQWARGLMGREGLVKGVGMFFIYPEEQSLTFWMKNMLFSIDIIFIDKDFIIRKIWHSVPPCVAEPCEIYSSGDNVMYVLEVNAGFSKLYSVIDNQRVQYIP